MFNKLRLKFSLMVSGITLLILTIISLTLNISLSMTTENSLLRQAEMAMRSLDETPPEPIEGEGDNAKDHNHDKEQRAMLPRFFSVTKSDEGYSFSSTTDFRLTEDELTSLADEAFSSNKGRGYSNSLYYYCYETKAVFLDAKSEEESLQNTLIISFSISGAAFLGISLLSFFLSKPVVKPYEELYNSQRRFLTDASHELKTPLAIINTNLELLNEELPNDKWIHSSLEQSDRMKNLISSMISLNKIEELSGNFKKEPFDIASALNEATMSYDSLSLTKKIDVSSDIPDSLIYNGNEELIFKLFGIMLDNAYKYVNEGGNIRISMKDERKRVTVLFENSVLELDENKLAHCFDRFYTCSDSRNRSSCGFGIGLSIAKAIVEGHDGEIKATAWKEGKGVSFYISLKK